MSLLPSHMFRKLPLSRSYLTICLCFRYFIIVLCSFYTIINFILVSYLIFKILGPNSGLNVSSFKNSSALLRSSFVQRTIYLNVANHLLIDLVAIDLLLWVSYWSHFYSKNYSDISLLLTSFFLKNYFFSFHLNLVSVYSLYLLIYILTIFNSIFLVLLLIFHSTFYKFFSYFSSHVVVYHLS